MIDFDILTEADETAIKANLPTWIGTNTEELQNHTLNIAQQVAGFASPKYEGSTPLIVFWLMQGLVWLDDDFNRLWSTRTQRLPTVAALKNYVAQLAQEALETELDEYGADPMGYLKRHPTWGVPAVTCHPWGAVHMEEIQAWLNATPYTVWSIYDKVHKTAQSELDRLLLDFVSGQDDGFLAELVAKHFDNEMKKWKTEMLADKVLAARRSAGGSPAEACADG
jgi:hypothetical protein